MVALTPMTPPPNPQPPGNDTGAPDDWPTPLITYPHGHFAACTSQTHQRLVSSRRAERQSTSYRSRASVSSSVNCPTLPSQMTLTPSWAFPIAIRWRGVAAGDGEP